MKRFASLFLILFCAAPVSASPIDFGLSWDGNPPGTFANLFELSGADAGAPDWSPGFYRITVDGGFSALVDQDIVGFDGPTACSSLVPCILGHAYFNPATHANQSTVLEVYQDRPWRLTGWSPYVGSVNSNGAQFAIAALGPNRWSWGFEDLRGGDNDYQDLFGTITFLRPHDPEPTPTPPTTHVPESSTVLLVAFGLVFIAKVQR